MAPNTAPRPPYDEEEFKERLLSEYAMLQSKVDTIGGFRFTIKGWSVVALGGAAAASSKVAPGTTLLLSGGLAILIFIFFTLEFEQVRLSRLYLARAGRIERGLVSVRRGRGTLLERRLNSPFTVNEIVFAQHEHRYAENDSVTKVARSSHFGIYLFLILLSLSIGGRNWVEVPKRFFRHDAAKPAATESLPRTVTGNPPSVPQPVPKGGRPK